jgi:hypothetical protein
LRQKKSPSDTSHRPRSRGVIPFPSRHSFFQRTPRGTCKSLAVWLGTSERTGWSWREKERDLNRKHVFHASQRRDPFGAATNENARGILSTSRACRVFVDAVTHKNATRTRRLTKPPSSLSLPNSLLHRRRVRGRPHDGHDRPQVPAHQGDGRGPLPAAHRRVVGAVQVESSTRSLKAPGFNRPLNL